MAFNLLLLIGTIHDACRVFGGSGQWSSSQRLEVFGQTMYFHDACHHQAEIDQISDPKILHILVTTVNPS